MAHRKALIIRLSSLGDVILSTSVLEALPEDAECDWLVAREFSPILEGHPRIRKVWSFDRAQGFAAWYSLGRLLLAEGYTDIFDLHRSLRSLLLRLQFRISLSGARWHLLPKERLRLWGYFVMKGLWPRGLRPASRRQAFAQCVGGTGNEQPSLLALAKKTSVPLPYGDRSFVAVMPASRWSAKEWPVQHYVNVLHEMKLPVVVLGTSSDETSALLVNELQNSGVEYLSGVGSWNLQQCANVLSRAKFYFGVDTGLAHLAEAVGTPAMTVFGPTQPDQGFGPWRDESQALGSELWCRPCGKDGRYCFRMGEKKHLCMKMYTPESGVRDLTKALSRSVNRMRAE